MELKENLCLFKSERGMEMIKKLFGETEEIQFAYLQKRLKVTAILLAAAAVLALLGEFASLDMAFPVGGCLAAVATYMWGWSFMSGFFGITTFGAIFGGRRNVFVGMLIVFVYLGIGLYFGAIALIIGLCRFIQLKTRQVESRRNSEQESNNR